MANPLFGRLPPELTDRILIQLDPIDLASLAQSSRHARRYIYQSEISSQLFHLIYLTHFDPPMIHPSYQPVMGKAGEIEGEVRSQFDSNSSMINLDWTNLLKRRIKLRQTISPRSDDLICSRLSKNYPGRERMRALYDDIFDLLNSEVDNSTSTTTSSKNVKFLNEIFRHNTPAQFRIIHYAGQNHQTQILFDSRPSLNDPLVSAAAELHTRYGLTDLDLNRPRSRGIARESCYALSNNHPQNLYGPFLPDRSGRVNWAYVEALSVVVGLNLTYAKKSCSDPSHNGGVLATPIVIHDTQEFHHTPIQIGTTWDDIDWPILHGFMTSRPNTQVMNPNYILPALPYPNKPCSSGSIDLNRYDWAGVEGKWLRVVCFLDYRDLHAYNFFGASPRPNLDDHNEAIRLMTLDLKVTSIGQPPDSDPTHPIPPCLNTSRRPPIYFGGTSVSNSSTTLVHATSLVRGCVSETPDGHIRWSVVSTFEGGDRWASEGIQVGGIRAKWGVVGVWTDVNRNDVEGPAGPFYFFKAGY